jgi:hypothetical protein
MSAAGEHWDGSFGYGAGRANPSVEYVACPYCKAPIGELCQGDDGPKLATHLRRREAFHAFQRRHAPK